MDFARIKINDDKCRNLKVAQIQEELFDLDPGPK